MTQYEDLKALVGKSMNETVDADWLEYWPVINEDGTIQDILHSDDFTASDETLVDWENGKPVVVDGTHGFDAVLR